MPLNSTSRLSFGENSSHISCVVPGICCPAALLGILAYVLSYELPKVLSHYLYGEF